jgi:4-carboxymuconolactone decarboxylase
VLRVTPPRIPPQDPADWDAEFLDALSVATRPGATRTMAEQTAPDRPRPVSNLLGTFSWHPALTKGWLAFNNHLFHSTLTGRLREIVTVRVSWLRQAEYEWAQHVKMARAQGVTDEEIQALSGGPDTEWSASDAAAIRATDEIATDRVISDGTWSRLAEHFNRQELLDLIFTVGAYDMLAMVCNTVGLQLDPGLEGFGVRA